MSNTIVYEARTWGCRQCDDRSLYDVRRQLCRRCYGRMHRRDELPPRPSNSDLLEIWRRVTSSGCWEWLGSISAEGYGRIGGSYVHRLSYEQSAGPIPRGLHIDHLCRNRRCFNPGHLEAVTRTVNAQRGARAWIINTGFCAMGHAMTAENTRIYVSKSGQLRRICRECHRTRNRNLYHDREYPRAYGIEPLADAERSHP